MWMEAGVLPNEAGEGLLADEPGGVRFCRREPRRKFWLTRPEAEFLLRPRRLMGDAFWARPDAAWDRPGANEARWRIASRLQGQMDR